jgi:23S rRNA (uracil1939-C5)-methyltransferase
VALRLGEAVAAGGDTLGRLDDGRVVFVEGGLPGEAVRAVVVEQRRDFARARVVEVDEASPVRRTPPCPWARAGCGGCQWQHVDPDAQLALKAGTVADALRRIAGLGAALPGPPPRAVDPRGYRTTLRLASGPEGRPSFRHRHRRDLLEVDGCMVAHPLLEDLVAGTRLRPGEGEVTLRVGVAGGERLVLPDRRAVVVSAPVDAVVAAPGRPAVLHEEAGGRRWRVSGPSFFQSGPAAADLLAVTVDAAVGADLGHGAVLVDLYAGVGLLGGVVAARAGARLVAVESSPEASADAVANLADLDASVVTADVAGWAPCPADVVVADPSRTGLGRPGVAAVIATGAPRVVLASCDPASGARDTALLVAGGYRPVALAVLDLFPHTVHVESVTTFERG